MKNGIVVGLVCVAVTLATLPTSSWGASRPPAKAATPAAAPVSADQLRQEWKVADLKLTREAVDDASYPPDIRQSAIDAIDMFLGQQEQLATDAAAKPETAAQARAKRLTLQADYQKKMAIIYKNPKFKAELDKRFAALDKEMDDLAAGAKDLFAKLDAAGVTPQQKAALQPVIAQAAQAMKTTAAKSTAGTTKDTKVRDEAVAKLRAAKAAINQKLTPAQQEKLKQKQVEGN